MSVQGVSGNWCKVLTNLQGQHNMQISDNRYKVSARTLVIPSKCPTSSARKWARLCLRSPVGGAWSTSALGAVKVIQCFDGVIRDCVWVSRTLRTGQSDSTSPGISCHMFDTMDVSPVVENVGDTSEESALCPLVLASVDPFGGRACLLLLCRRCTPCSQWKGIVGSGLGPFGCPEPFFHVGRAEEKRDPVRVVPLVDASASHLVS